MEKMNDLRDLLKHEIYDLRSAEQQIIKALPAMITKANNMQLKTALQEHLQITETHLARLEKLLAFFNEESGAATTDKKGLLARLFKRNHLCKGMQGLIEEGEKVISEDMNPEVLDAAIIASAQKIEHYEICGYGTAKAFAVELNFTEAVRLLDETLQEEYDADTRLTEMAVSRVNKKAEVASKNSESSPQSIVKNNPAYEARNAIQERSVTKEPELVADKTALINPKKQAPAKNKAPKHEAHRTDTAREKGAERRSSGNSKKAKTSPARKSTEARPSKTGRSR